MLAAGITCAPLAQADTGDQASAEQAVTGIYNRVIPGCASHHKRGQYPVDQLKSVLPDQWR